MSRFSIAGKVYDGTTIDKISLRDIITFKQQATDLGLSKSFNDIEALSQLSEKDLENSEDKYLLMGVMIWLARRAAGEDITLADACDISPADIVMLPDPEDRKPGEAKRPTSRTRKASAPVAAAAAVPSE